MTAHKLHQDLADLKARGALSGQPPDLQSVIVTSRSGHTSRRSLEAGAAIISKGGHISDFSESNPLWGFGGLPPWEELNAPR